MCDILFTNNIRTLAVTVIEFITLKAEASLNIVLLLVLGMYAMKKGQESKISAHLARPEEKTKKRQGEGDNEQEY